MNQTLTDEFRLVPLELIVPSPTNPRKHFGQHELEELAENIKAMGVLSPILIRPLADGYEIVAGERRYRASQLAKLAEIPCRIKDLTDEQAYEIQITENLQREDISPLEEADAFFQLLNQKKRKITAEEIARRVGKSLAYVYQRMKLRDLCPQGRKLVALGTLPMTYAIELARIPEEAQVSVLRGAVDYLPDLEEEESLWNDVVLTDSLSVFKNGVRRNMLDLSQAIFAFKATPSCAACPKRTGFNKTLFNDIQEKDFCTDASCYEQKEKTHLQSELDKVGLHNVQLISMEKYSNSTLENGLVLRGFGTIMKEAEVLEVIEDNKEFGTTIDPAKVPYEKGFIWESRNKSEMGTVIKFIGKNEWHVLMGGLDLDAEVEDEEDEEFENHESPGNSTYNTMRQIRESLIKVAVTTPEQFQDLINSLYLRAEFLKSFFARMTYRSALTIAPVIIKRELTEEETEEFDECTFLDDKLVDLSIDDINEAIRLCMLVDHIEDAKLEDLQSMAKTLNLVD
jgi:ParB/RepB/Spo0J family partition protein